MNLKIQAQKRELGKKSDIKNLRKDGFVPAVVYGEGKEGLPIYLNYRDFFSVYKKSFGQLVFFDLNIDGEEIRTIIKDKQIHPVSRQIIHIDFQELHAGKEIQVDIPLQFVGDAPGTKEGGHLEVMLRSLTCQSLPRNIKDDIVVDISGMQLHDVITVGDLDLGEMGTKVADDLAVVSVHVPRAHKEAEEEEEGEEGEEAAEATEAE